MVLIKWSKVRWWSSLMAWLHDLLLEIKYPTSPPNNFIPILMTVNFFCLNLVILNTVKETVDRLSRSTVSLIDSFFSCLFILFIYTYLIFGKHWIAEGLLISFWFVFCLQALYQTNDWTDWEQIQQIVETFQRQEQKSGDDEMRWHKTHDMS